MTVVAHWDQAAEEAVLGSILLLGDARTASGFMARGLRPEHFYEETNGAIFKAAAALAERGAATDEITLYAELDRLGLRGKVDRGRIDYLAACVPSAANRGDYADRVIELARWRRRERATYALQEAAAARDATRWARAQAALDSAVAGTRTETYSPSAWADLLWNYYSASKEEVAEYGVPLPFARLNEAMGGGLAPGESLALSGPTNHGKSLLADQWLDYASQRGKRCHLYMTEMTAINRGLRYMARRTGVPYLRQRARKDLTQDDFSKIFKALESISYGVSIAADWDVEDIVRDALRARYDFVVIDLLHGFHYEDERGLDRLSKAVQRLARASTTIDGHKGTAVCAITHLKEEGVVKGKIPRPTITSIKGGSSIKQDCDFVGFVWQDQEDGSPTGEAEVWIEKARSGQREKVLTRLNSRHFRFDLRAEELPGAAAGSAF